MTPHPTPTSEQEMREEFLRLYNANITAPEYINFHKPIADFWLAHLRTAYESGRQSVLDELDEEQRKFTEGFAYKPKETNQ